MIVFQIDYSFSKTFFMSHIAPRWKNTTISIQKKLPPPPHLSTHHPPTLSLSGGAQLQRALEIMASMDAEEAFEDHLREGSLWVVHSWRLTAGTCPHGGLVQIIFLSKLVICRFHVNLPGCTADGSEIRLTYQLRGAVVEVPLFTRFLHHPRWLFGISTINSSNAPYGWVVLLISAEGFLQIQTLLGGSSDGLRA